jgi:hypothetical protein
MRDKVIKKLPELRAKYEALKPIRYCVQRRGRGQVRWNCARRSNPWRIW